MANNWRAAVWTSPGDEPERQLSERVHFIYRADQTCDGNFDPGVCSCPLCLVNEHDELEIHNVRGTLRRRRAKGDYVVTIEEDPAACRYRDDAETVAVSYEKAWSEKDEWEPPPVPAFILDARERAKPTEVEIDFSDGGRQEFVLERSTHLRFRFPGVGSYRLTLKQDAVGGRDVSFGKGVLAAGGSINVGGSAGAITEVAIRYDGKNSYVATTIRPNPYPKAAVFIEDDPFLHPGRPPEPAEPMSLEDLRKKFNDSDG